jgi:hypothetical protein
MLRRIDLFPTVQQVPFLHKEGPIRRLGFVRILPQTFFRFRQCGIHLPSALQHFNVREIGRRGGGWPFAR